MNNNLFETTFKNSYNLNDWKRIINALFKNARQYKTPIETIDKSIKYHQVAKSIKEFGSASLADDKVIKFYDIELEEDKHVTKNRVGLRNLIHGEVIPGNVDAILAVFHTKGDKDWRLTFISKSIYWDEDYNENKEETSPKRFTYVLGEDESVKTAVLQFENLLDKKLTIKDLIEVFNVEKLNKIFFDDYKKHYNKFWSYLLKTDKYYKLFSGQNKEKVIRDFTKKLLGRIVFLHFLQKKGWMGCDSNTTQWINGKKQFMSNLLEGFEDKEHFHSKCLTELFFNTLNKKRENNIFNVKGLSNEINKTKIPYLNGGLFETDTNINVFNIDFPHSYFQELFDFFGQYNFTIDENSPDDHEVGIDPEMLGHIFENLLEENKEKGAFYTPKEIVQYMTQESLIQYLQTHLGEHIEIENFIKNNDKGDELAKHNYIRDNAKQIEELLDKVKICDPAIGSGAFPMGMLKEIFKAKMALDWTLDRGEVKKAIIQNSIYGVDIESGAVDIARLRFWLALVVDEDEPQALPNLDYKIMQGNSLLESFEGIDLSKIHQGTAIEIDADNSMPNLFSQALKKKENTQQQEKLEDLIKRYFGLDNPEEKQDLHTKIDQQVLNNIYFTLNDKKEELEKDIKKLNRKIKIKSANLRNADQKIKYETASREAKNLKKLKIQLENIDAKQLKLKELYHSNERPFFLWHLFFKEVFDKGGFDIVIANPPYIDIKGLPNEMVKLFFSIYETTQNRMNIYSVFVEQGMNLCKSNGCLSYIIPNSILLNSSYSKIRKYLINDIKFIVKLPDNIFKNASVETIIFNAVKKCQIKTISGAYYKNNERIDFSNLKFRLFDKKDWLNDPKNKFNIFVSPDIVGILNKLEFKTNPISDFFDFSLGITPYDKYKGHSKELINNKEYHSVTKVNEDYVPLISGKNVLKYHIDEKIEQFLKYGNWLGASRQKRFFTKPRVIVRQILSGKPPTIYAGYTNKELFHTQIGFSILPKSRSKISIKVLCALLNSRLLNFYHKYRFLDIEKITFQKILIENCKSLPLPINFPINFSFILEVIVDEILFIKRLKKVTNKIIESNISQTFEEVIDALVFELYFPEEFIKANIHIYKNAIQYFNPIDNLPVEQQKEIIISTYHKLKEKDNPLQKEIAKMYKELKQLLDPILSV